MIKEYEDVKRFLDQRVSSKYLDAAVIVDDIFTDEYNALDITIIGERKISNDFYFNLQSETKKKYGHIVNGFEMISPTYKNHTSIIVYLIKPIELRHSKLRKIKSKITV